VHAVKEELEGEKDNRAQASEKKGKGEARSSKIPGVVSKATSLLEEARGTGDLCKVELGGTEENEHLVFAIQIHLKRLSTGEKKRGKKNHAGPTLKRRKTETKAGKKTNKKKTLKPEPA